MMELIEKSLDGILTYLESTINQFPEGGLSPKALDMLSMLDMRLRQLKHKQHLAELAAIVKAISDNPSKIINADGLKSNYDDGYITPSRVANGQYIDHRLGKQPWGFRIVELLLENGDVCHCDTQREIQRIDKSKSGHAAVLLESGQEIAWVWDWDDSDGVDKIKVHVNPVNGIPVSELIVEAKYPKKY